MPLSYVKEELRWRIQYFLGSSGCVSLWTGLVPQKCFLTLGTFAKSFNFSLDRWPSVFGEMLLELYSLTRRSSVLPSLHQPDWPCSVWLQPAWQDDSLVISTFKSPSSAKMFPGVQVRENATAFQHFLFTQVSKNCNQNTLKLLTFVLAHLFKLCP